jgi:hypothetical protein
MQHALKYYLQKINFNRCDFLKSEDNLFEINAM